MQLLDPAWFGSGLPHDLVAWLYGEGPNPYSCAALGEGVSIFTTLIVSKLTKPLPKEHVDELFGSRHPADGQANSNEVRRRNTS
jgi:hypothetical protein